MCKLEWGIGKGEGGTISLSGGSEVKASACNAGDLGLIPGSGRSPGEGNGNPLQYSCLENPMDGETWWATVHGVAESDTTERLHFSDIYQDIFPNLSMPLLCKEGRFSPKSFHCQPRERKENSYIPMWTKSLITGSQCKCLWWQVKYVSESGK